MPSISRQSSLARSQAEEDDTVRLNRADAHDEVEIVSMSRTDMRMIKRLAKRANVIPVSHDFLELKHRSEQDVGHWSCGQPNDIGDHRVQSGGLARYAKRRTGFWWSPPS